MSNEDLKDLLTHLAASAKQVNLYTGDYAQANYYEAGGATTDGKATDEQICRAIAAINGKDKILRHHHAFLGVCCYLASKQKWPNDLEVCAQRVALLNTEGEWYYPCKWENFRKYKNCRFALTDYADWDDYKPKGTEAELFKECRDVARALDLQLQVEMQK